VPQSRPERSKELFAELALGTDLVQSSSRFRPYTRWSDARHHKADDIALVIRRRSFGGARPGNRPSPGTLSEQFSVSPHTCARGVCGRLAALGLVSFVPEPGVRVRTISREELHEAFMVRAELESLATESQRRRSRPRSSTSGQLRAELLADLAGAARARAGRRKRARSMGDWVRGNHAFHDISTRRRPAARRADGEECARDLLGARGLGAGRPSRSTGCTSRTRSSTVRSSRRSPPVSAAGARALAR